ncbi:MAG TPA: YitT family protein [Saprospiraceae bacterium]|nr:YitT family protein [Saprospiraceae bacterium]
MNTVERIDWKRIFSWHSLAFSLLGVFLATVALKGFMMPNRFLDGGITGLSILLHELFHVDIHWLLIVLNLPFVYIGYRKIGKTFAVQTMLAVLLLVICLLLLDIDPITNDKVLIAMFGGFFIGLGIGFVIKAGGVIDGMEVVADYTNKKLGLTTSEIVMFFNSAIILAAAYFFGIETAMYSILTYFTAMKTSDYVVDGFEEYTAMTIISPQFEAIKSCIVNDFNKAISVYKGERGYLPGSYDVKHDTQIIVTILTRLEIHRLQKAIYEIDPNAFLYISSIKEVSGGVVKQKVKR